MENKFFTLLLAAVIGTTIGHAATYSGNLSKTITWSLNTSTGLLTISGSGSMEEVYQSSSRSYPWNDYYESVKKVVIGEGITSIGSYAFYDCENLTSATLPSTLDSICYCGFENTKITSLTLPKNLHFIETSAFDNCTALKTLNLSDALEVIPQWMCGNCTALQQITIPDNVKEIEYQAFVNCTSLNKVTWGSGIRTIRRDAFVNTALEEDSKNWKNNVFYIGKVCIRGGEGLSGAVTVKDGTTLIAEDAFNSMPITSVTLPNSLLYINEFAFQLCDKLSSVSFGSSLLEIDDYAFDVTPITQLNFSAALQKIGLFAFSQCDKLTSVSFNSSLKEICDGAFYMCSSLTSVVIPDNVTTIGDGAFDECSALEDITIGRSVVDMVIWYAFEPEAVKNLTFNAIHAKDVDYALYYYSVPSNLETITFGDEVEYIPEELCYMAEKLTAVTFPKSIKEIDDEAFCGCKALKKVTIPNKVTKIGYRAFADCEAMTTLTIGQTVTDIDYTAFENTPIKTLKWNAKHCNDFIISMSFDKLTSITFGSSVEYIPSNLCNDAVKLPSVTFPQSVKEIGKSAFEGCSSLTELTIPENITKINDMAFFYCENVKTVTCGSSAPPTLGSGVFNYIAEDATLRVPCGSLKAYKKTAWKNDFSKFEEYFPHSIELSSADETMGTVVMGDLNCTEGSVQIDAQAKTGFVFVAWSDGNTEASRTLQVTQDTTLVATFRVQTFHIQFVDWNGTLIQESDVNYNTIPSKPNNPTRPATAQYTYSFKAWEPEVVAALADAVYMAQYDSVLNEYTVTFLNEDGSLIESKKWKYGEMPSCEEPAKESTAEMAYHFDHWNPAIETVTGEATYQAVFRAVPIYTLVFLDWNGDLIDVVKAEEGTAAILPADPARTGHTFVGWSRDLSSVGANMYVIALYEAVSTGIDVIFKSSDDRILSTQSADLSLPVVPETEQPGFLGWFVESGNLLDGIIIRAHNDSTPTAIPESPARQEEQTSKILRDGQILILRGNKVYTITGQTVK